MTSRSSDLAPVEHGPSQADTDQAEASAFEEILQKLEGMSAENPVMAEALRHIITRVTDEGLIVEMFDLPDAPLFLEEGTSPAPVTVLLVEALTGVFGTVVNPLALDGHTRTYTVVQANDPRWNLSTARAERMRVLFEDQGFDPQRIARVAGHADRRPAHSNPMAVRNNRLELILLRDKGQVR